MKTAILKFLDNTLNQSFIINNNTLRIRYEQLRTRLAVFPFLVLTQVVLEPLFAWLFWSSSSHALLVFWVLTFYSLHAFELNRWNYFHHHLNDLASCMRCHHFLSYVSAAKGLMWGAAAVLFFPAQVEEQILLICVMFGLMCGAIATNPVHPNSLYGYVFGILLPFGAKLLYEMNSSSWNALWEYLRADYGRLVVAGMLLIFVTLILLVGRTLYKTVETSLQQRFLNLDLAETLAQQKAHTEAVRSQLEYSNAELQQHEQQLQSMVLEQTSLLQQRNVELSLIREATIFALSTLAEIRDNETGNHICRTQRYMRALALQLKDHPRFKNFLTDENIELLFKLAPLHDIGKIGIPDHILRKPGKLTADEFEIMKKHPILGGNAIAAAEKEIDIESHFLRIARQIAIGHHEKWDGSGYPFGLYHDDIPIPARLMALADVYDALSCERVYKPALPHEKVVDMIIDGRAKHFDPDIVDAFMEIKDEFARIAASFHDVTTGKSALDAPYFYSI